MNTFSVKLSPLKYVGASLIDVKCIIVRCCFRCREQFFFELYIYNVDYSCDLAIYVPGSRHYRILLLFIKKHHERRLPSLLMFQLKLNVKFCCRFVWCICLTRAIVVTISNPTAITVTTTFNLCIF